MKRDIELTIDTLATDGFEITDQHHLASALAQALTRSLDVHGLPSSSRDLRILKSQRAAVLPPAIDAHEALADDLARALRGLLR